jgi:hypothetical protein
MGVSSVDKLPNYEKVRNELEQVINNQQQEKND